MRRGEVYWFSLLPPNKRRPVVILTKTRFIPLLNSVTVAPITSTMRDIPSQVILTPDDGMPETCSVNLHNLQTVPRNKLLGKALITRLSPARLEQIGKAVKFALHID